MNHILRDNLLNYSSYIKRQKYKLDKKYNKYNVLCGGKDMSDNANEIRKKMEMINTVHNVFDNLTKRVDTLIEKIDNTNDIQTGNTSDTIKIKTKLIGIQEAINKIINIHSFTEETLPPSEIYQKTKQDTYDKLTIIYTGILDEHKKISEKIKSITSGQLQYIYDSLNDSINKLLIDNIPNFKKLINETLQLLKNNVEFSLDIFNKNDIVFETSDIYNYTKVLSNTIKQESITPAKLYELLNLLEFVIEKLVPHKHVVDNIESKIDDVIINAFDINVLYKAYQKGGSIDVQKYEIMMDNFAKLAIEINNCNGLMEKYNSGLFEYSTKKIQLNNFMLFLTAIIIMPKLVPSMLIYTHINKGLLQFYLTIINIILNNIVSKKSDNRPDINYFYEYHYVTLLYLQNFLKFMVGNMKTKDVININKCSGSVTKGFTILIYFKDILESYHEVLQSKVTIYSRINDWSDGTLPQNEKDKMFVRDKDNARYLIINRSSCGKVCGSSNLCLSLGSDETKILFTEVFDTENFERNGDITKYMTLETQLSKKKGVMMMTYGYSGTGKTFTLFGSGKTNKQGILQSTLGNIRGLQEVRFRVLELYGVGVQYPHYWKGHVKSNVVTYDLKITNDEIDIIGHTEKDKIIQIFNEINTGFVSLTGENNIIKTFKSFDSFISKLDDIRKKENRIRITSNNPESSRSVVIYEFHLLVNDTYVPFVIIDLPGREEIVETYTDNYLMRDFIPSNKKTPFHKALLSSMSINPLGLAILVPSVIFETFNSLDKKSRFDIMDKDISVDFIKHDDDSEDEELNETLAQAGGEIFRDEILSKDNKLSFIYNFNNGEWINNRMFAMLTNPNANSQQNTIVDIRGVSGKLPSNKEQINVKINSIQYQAVLAIHVMNRLILLNRFDIIEIIYKNIIEKYFDMPELKVIVDKRTFLKKYFDENKINDSNETEINYLFDQLVNFRTYMAPFEGIFINETIMGLIKSLASLVLEKNDNYIRSNLMQEQDKSLGFTEKKIEIRNTNIKLYNVNDTLNYENIHRSDKVLEDMFISNRISYSSQKVFNYDHPSIEPIIKMYISKRSVGQIPLNPVSDFKMFYLFSNTQMGKKCMHQWKLVNNTLSFINAINET